MAFPVVEEVIESSTTSAGTNHIVTLPTATANQLLLIVLDKGSTAATINTHSELTELLDENLANGLYVAYRWMDGVEPASYTLVSSASTRSAHFAYRISGTENPATQAPQIGTTSSGTSATPDPPLSAAPGSTKDYLFIACYGAAGEEADDDTWSDTSPTNYTPSLPRQKACGVAGTNLGGLLAAAERQLNTGVAQDPGTFTKDVSAAWRGQTILVHPSSQTTTTVEPGIVSLVTARFTPTVELTAVVAPGVVALTLTRFTPVVQIQSITTVTPGVRALITTVFVPTVSVITPVTVIPGVAALTTVRFTPTVTVQTVTTVAPGLVSLNLTVFAPDVITFTAVGSPFLYTSANYGTPAVYLEAYLRAISGTAYARLYDVTTAVVVTSSELSTTSSTFQRLRSSAITLTNAHEYRMQLGKSGSGEALTGQLIVVNS